jgi:hypothetical protein
MEPCGTPVCRSLGVDISPSTESELSLRTISLTRLVEHFNLDNLYSKPKCHVISKASFDIQEYRSRRYVIVEM